MPRAHVTRVELQRALETLREESRLQAEHWLEVNSALKDALEHYVALYNDAPFGFVTLDQRGTIIEINSVAADLLGQQPELLLSKPFLAYVARGGAKAFSRHLQMCARGSASVELLVGKAKGPHREVRLVTRVLTTAALTRGRYLTTLIDITEQRQSGRALRTSEKLHRDIVETANEGICIVNAAGEIVFVNRRLAAMLGTPAAALIGRYATDIVIDNQETTGGEMPARELSHSDQMLRHSGGALIPVSVSTSVMRDEEGEVTGSLRMFTDATARYELTAAREMLVRQLVSAQEGERQRIARELHDQLGQHIVGLSLGLARLATTTVDGEQRELIDLLRRQADLLGKDVHTLAMQLRPSALDHLGLAAALRAYAEEVAERSGLDIDVQCEPWDEGGLKSELQTGLYRIAQEALTNIVKHARARHVSVILERDRETIRLIVEDDGRGFDVRQLNRSEDGGLGLAGIRERASLLGGNVTIESAAGTGTTIFVRIPVQPESVNDYEQKTSIATGG